MDELKKGDTVTAIYKTGKYIGELTEIRSQHYLVRVLAVLKHPVQGDLHSPKEAEGVFFHERRALAFREQTNVPKQMVKLHTGDVPEYTESLREAVGKMKTDLTADGSAWAQKSLQNIRELEKDYFK